MVESYEKWYFANSVCIVGLEEITYLQFWALQVCEDCLNRHNNDKPTNQAKGRSPEKKIMEILGVAQIWGENEHKNNISSKKMGKIAHIECMVKEAIWATPESFMIFFSESVP